MLKDLLNDLIVEPVANYFCRKGWHSWDTENETREPYEVIMFGFQWLRFTRSDILVKTCSQCFIQYELRGFIWEPIHDLAPAKVVTGCDRDK